jgi:hypothetical protein
MTSMRFANEQNILCQGRSSAQVQCCFLPRRDGDGPHREQPLALSSLNAADRHLYRRGLRAPAARGSHQASSAHGHDRAAIAATVISFTAPERRADVGKPWACEALVEQLATDHSVYGSGGLRQKRWLTLKAAGPQTVLQWLERRSCRWQYAKSGR